MADRYDWDRERAHDRENDRQRMDWDRNREFDRQHWPDYAREGRGREDWNREWDRRGRSDYDRYQHENRYGREGWGAGGREDWNRGRDDWAREGRDDYAHNRERESYGDYGRGNWSGSEREYGGQNWNQERNDFGRNAGQFGSSGWNRRGEYRRQDDYGSPRRGGASGYYGAGMGSYGGGMGSYGGGMGTYSEGRHAGRGPKNWQRSDERIREDINERLTQHPHIDASEIDVQVKHGEVTLTGTVDERNAKRMAEDIAEGVSGVKDVHNQIRVQQYEGATSGSNTAAASGSHTGNSPASQTGSASSSTGRK